jgi:type I restriction enzyme S subunit
MITLQERVHGVKPPKDWPLSKLHHVFTVRKNNKNIGMLNDNLLSLSYGRIVNKDIDTTEGLLPESFETYQIVYPGDVVLRLTDLQNDKRSIRQGLVKEKGIITSAYDAVYPASGHDPRYWAYALLAMDLAKYYYSMGGGVRQSIKFKDFPNDWLHTPSQDTQKEIANFLDRETARIDLLIEKKNHLIHVLEEKKQNIIDHEITGALFEKRRSINLPWIKDIPSHWEFLAIKKVLSTPITDGPHETPNFVDDGVIFISAEALQDGGIDFNRKRGFITSEDNLIYSRKYSPQKGDIYVVKSGATTGKSAIVGDFLDFNIWSPLAVLRANKNMILNQYLLYVIRSSAVQNAIALNWSWGTQQNIGMGVLGRIAIPIPTLNEQKLAIKNIEHIAEQADQTIQLTKKSIESIKEYRTALITEAVTGRLDIHAWQKRGTGDRKLDQIERDTKQEHKSKKARA